MLLPRNAMQSYPKYSRGSFNLFNVSDEIHFFRSLGAFPVNELGAYIHEREKSKGEVVGKEFISGPFALQENSPSTKLYSSFISVYW